MLPPSSRNLAPVHSRRVLLAVENVVSPKLNLGTRGWVGSGFGPQTLDTRATRNLRLSDIFIYHASGSMSGSPPTPKEHSFIKNTSMPFLVQALNS